MPIHFHIQNEFLRSSGYEQITIHLKLLEMHKDLAIPAIKTWSPMASPTLHKIIILQVLNN